MFVHPQFDPIAIAIGPARGPLVRPDVPARLHPLRGPRRIHAQRRPELGWTPQQIDDLLFYGVLG